MSTWRTCAGRSNRIQVRRRGSSPFAEPATCSPPKCERSLTKRESNFQEARRSLGCVHVLDFRVASSRLGNTAVVAISGELDLHTAERVAAKLSNATSEDAAS